jgi:hypothetical protein
MVRGCCSNNPPSPSCKGDLLVGQYLGVIWVALCRGEGLVENEGRQERRTGSREQWRADESLLRTEALMELTMK